MPRLIARVSTAIRFFQHFQVIRRRNMNLTCEKVVKLGENGNQKPVELAAESLLNGHIIAVPTDTIYGIAGLAQNSDAIGRIYNIKRRDLRNPIAISVGTVQDFYKWSKVVVPAELLEDLLPGPVTVVLQRSDQLNPDLNPGTDLVGIRIPNHPFIINLAQKCGGPIALTSANISSTKSTLNVQEFHELWPQLDLICDGGQLGDTEFSRRGSTVVDLSVRGKYKIIRDGSAKKETVELLEEKYSLVEQT
ncbi:threonylcarbamoyl-AMP synthase-like [Mercenaria mercenaria]|uniref:threonylcarbamoyl-AMP synthase-like n=1 Tax=Mercenaria mercenaria TaxID=6596 RepID=UPI00234FA95F|nr:threonylcarbamoyl-AMP synthase-like [Mercenaria mercenaria]